MKRNEERVFQSTGVLTFALGMLLLLMGCSSSPDPDQKRPGVEELFRQALRDSRVLNEDPAREVAAEETQETSEEEQPSSAGAKDNEGEPVNGGQERKKVDVPGRDEPGGPEVTSTFTQTQVRQAIQVIANQADVSVLMDQQVQGVVTARINKEPFELALQRLLLPLGLVYRQADDKYYVGVPDPSSSLYPYLSVQKQYRVKQVKPEKLRELLPKRQQKYVRISSEHQELIVEAPKRIAHTILNRLKSLDEEVQQVVIEAMVVVFSPNTRFRFGFDFSQGIRVRGNDFVNVMMDGLNLSGQYGPPQFNAVRNFSFTSAFLEMLAEEGYLTIRASPRVMARGGEEAKIRIGRQTFFSTTPNVDEAQFFDQDIRDVESGIVLEMVPVIRGDDVLIDLSKVEVSEEIRTTQSARALNPDFPVINRRTVSTKVQIQNGHTLVIGGLVQRSVIDQQAEVPGVSGVPLLGKLFTERDQQTRQREVAIFLAPRIVKR